MKPNRESDFSDPLKPKPDDTDAILDKLRYIEGRRYHNGMDVDDTFPNDDKEADRLNLRYNISKLTWKDHFSSPMHELLKSGKAKVLDVGCGTGQWLLDMTKDYPRATFVGVDTSPMFPGAKITPSNVIFLQVDGLPNETFDFVCQRSLRMAMIHVTKSDAWSEFSEESDHQESSPFVEKMKELAYFELEAKGINAKPEACVPQHLESCRGLTEIHHEEVHAPIGNWAGPLVSMINVCFSLEPLTMRCTT